MENREIDVVVGTALRLSEDYLSWKEFGHQTLNWLQQGANASSTPSPCHIGSSETMELQQAIITELKRLADK